MPKIDIAKILANRECPGCKWNKPGAKSDCTIKLHYIYGEKVSPTMEQWCEKQTMSGYCKQRSQK